MSVPRKRLTPEASRDLALVAARELLLEEGPAAVTLKAVAGRIGRTHANLLHHFGSAAGLQQALVTTMAEQITATIGAAVEQVRAGHQTPQSVVDLTFDAFGREGAGALASWMILTGNQHALDPVLEAIHELVDDLAEQHQDRDHGASIHEETLELVLMAMGDALLGPRLTRALGLPADSARRLALKSLMAHRGI